MVGADTRSTSGEIVADKNCMKIHDLAPNMVRVLHRLSITINKLALILRRILKTFESIV